VLLLTDVNGKTIRLEIPVLNSVQRTGKCGARTPFQPDIQRILVEAVEASQD
jgi:hypothetical protein